MKYQAHYDSFDYICSSFIESIYDNRKLREKSYSLRENSIPINADGAITNTPTYFCKVIHQCYFF